MEADTKKLAKKLSALKGDRKDYYKVIVNAPFDTHIPLDIDLGTIVLLVDNETSGYIERVALSQTPAALEAARVSAVPFNEIKIPRTYKKSLHVQALQKKKAQSTSDWAGLFTPALSEDHARDNQQSAGIITSVVQPFYGKKQNGTLIFSLYCEEGDISKEASKFFEWYADLVGQVF